jgi:hypothetical protein
MAETIVKASVVATLGCVSAVTLFLPMATAATNNVIVPGTADVWLAGQANGTALQNILYPLPDVAPANSPVLASTGLNMTAGSYLTFSVTGSTDYNGCASASPDGNGCVPFSANLPFFGISLYSGPINALVGVFVAAGTPGGAAPAGLNFLPPASQAQTTISPQLNQVFFIGDGLTATGGGSVQQFVIPAGATRLYLGSSDGPGANFNNSGSFTVAVSDAASPSPSPSPGSAPQGVPAVSPFALLLTALLVAAAGGYWVRSRAA